MDRHGHEPTIEVTKDSQHTSRERAEPSKKAEKSGDWANVRTAGSSPALQTEPSSSKLEHRGHEPAAAAEDLERAGGQKADTVRKRSRFTALLSGSSSRPEGTGNV